MTPEQARLWSLVVSQQDVIVVVLRRLNIHGADHEDLTQDALLQAWQLIAAGKLVLGAEIRRPDIAVRTWLAFVARWIALLWLRSDGRKRRLEVAEGDAEFEIEGYEDLGARVEARELVTRLVGLCTRQERAILAETAEGATHDEIGRKLGMPAGSVGTKLRYVRRHLRKHRKG